MNNKNIFIVLVLLNLSLYANTLKPIFILKSKGFVNDFVLDKGEIYVANDEGSVEVFNLNTQKLKYEIFIEPIYTVKQTWQNAKILSVDRQNGKTLLVSNTHGPYRDVWIHNGDTLKQVISIKDKLSIKEARFIADDKYIFGTLGYEMILYSPSDSYNQYKNQVEQSSFSDLELSEDKKTMVTASESGIISLSSVKTGKLLKTLKPLSLDKVYQVAYKNGTIITGSQDRRVGVYPKDAKPYFIESDFLVYSVALSPDGKTGIYSSSQNSELQLFDVKTGTKLIKLIGHYAIPTVIKFYDNNSLFSAGYEDKIFYWRFN